MTTSVRAAKVKLVVAIAFDLADFVIGRVIGIGTGFDIVLTAIGFALFGWKGLAQAWEVVDVTDQIDGFIPTLTLLALAELREAKKREAQKTA
ncbi:hypothetical protein [Parvularcula lutaonensis]|uniref:Holin n=1 Tax=Parvularcula lutaonensis TaxID=491923 RepID=A0ABV7MCN0_9PROT|nr:hypothetical protein [Parvularcula lutaonensis]GGY38310.1 hypothetical protein GCM10007148_03270 [Parvularcula lutaonensis]